MATIQAIEARSVHQIQSGQVITDLCSVAKELVENSLDAGATTLEIRFKNNGLDLIEVQDNGGGISPDNYENVALKHYTSKLSTYDDLANLHTFGFRGEALSSLCALADFHVVTAQANQAPRANRLDFEVSGKLRKTQIVAGQKGTTASVAGIFKRLPVRRRELEKNIKREYGKVLNLLHAYACISTGVRFSVRNTVGKTKNVVVFSTNGNKTTKENIANVYGAKTLSALIPLDLELDFEPSAPARLTSDEDQTNQIHVRGHISRPVFGEGRQTPDRQMFFVNTRPCGLPQIAKAFNEVYKSFNVSQSPFIFADFQMDTSAYDVNVSPDKRTIMLHDAGAMIESLKSSLAKMFEAADQTVPQSQILGSKAAVTKQQSLGALPGFVSARQVNQGLTDSPATPKRAQDDNEIEIPETQQTAPSVIQRFKNSRDATSEVNPLSSPSKPARESPPSLKEPTAATSSIPEEEQLFVPSEPQAQDTSDRYIPPDSIIGESDEFPEPLSQTTEPSTTVVAETNEETPNVVQTAFDRMRPRRLPAEMATITIGDQVVTSMVGSGVPRKRRSDFGASTKEPRQSRRKIHIPSRPNIFGKHMKAFSAPGTQTEEDDNNNEEEEEEEEEEEDIVDDIADEDDGEEEGDEEASEAEIDESEDDAEEAISPESEDGDYIPEEDHAPGPSNPPENETAVVGDVDDVRNPDTEEIDDEKKKAKEDELVQRLIHKAEETAVAPEENSAIRANKMNKGAVHRDTTVNLIGTIDASVARLQSQIKQLQHSLVQQTPSKPQNTDSGDEKTAEDRLSLIVSKTDFAQMRIIGQFNLGFIIAVRPGEDHDELFIIDQHASDEKFNFERLQAETVVQNQRLVRPQRLDLTAVEEEIVIENRESLEKNGFIVTVDESGDEPIGRRCQLVSLPLSKEVVFGSRDLEELIVLLSEAPVVNSLSVPRPGKVRKMFAMRACRSSIMIGKTLTTRQMQRVVRNMGTIDKPWNCPHGRPTMRHLISLGQSEAWSEYDDPDPDMEIDADEVEPTGLDIWKRFLEGDIEEESDS